MPMEPAAPNGQMPGGYRPQPVRVMNPVRLPRKDSQDVRRDGPQTVQPTEENPLVNSPGLSGHIYRVWTRARLARTSQIDGRLLKCLAQKKGEYTQDQLQTIEQSGGSSTIFYKLTSAKCRALVSWMMEIMLPSNDKAWGIEPTPQPDIPPEEVEALAKGVADAIEAAAQNAEGGIPITEQLKIAGQARDDFMAAILETAKKASERMERKIEDIFAEGGWVDALIDFFDNFATYPAAILEGPVWEQRKTLKWGPGFKPIITTEPRMMFYARSPFDAYPAPHAKSTQDGDFCLRIQIHAADLYALIGLPGYSEKAITAVLEAGTSGKLDNWLGLEQQRRILEGSTSTWQKAPETYDGIKYFGRVRGDWLQEWAGDAQASLQFGQHCPEEDREIKPMCWYDITAIQIGNDVIFAELNPDPLGRRTIHSASYDPVPHAFWGESVPDLVRDSQGMCNAAARALEDNSALCSGPQVIVHTDLLAPGENIEGIHPMGVWQVRTTTDQGIPLPAGTKPVEFWQPQSIANVMLPIMDAFERRSDDESGIPRFSYGNSEQTGGAATAALADYERVHTPAGPVPICALSVGDDILNSYGGVSKVTGVYPQGVRDIFRLSFSNGERVDCDMEHRWALLRRTDGPVHVLTVADIMRKGLYRTRKATKKMPSGKMARWGLPFIEAVGYPERYVSIDPYTMGVMIGNGDARCRVTAMDHEVFDNIPYEKGAIDDQPGTGKAWSRTILGVKKEYHAYGLACSSSEKFIPEDYRYNTPAVRLELLRGLMDTDGCCAKNGTVFFSTSSEQLAKDFVWLVRSLGGRCKGASCQEGSSFVIKGRTSVRLRNYRVHFTPTTDVLFKVKRKQDRMKKRRRERVMLTGIERIGTHTATCISVDAKDSLYLTETFLPSHNTGMSMLMNAAAKGIRRAVTVVDTKVVKGVVELVWTWLMLNDPDKAAKADSKVVPRGAAAILIKEQMQQARMQFLGATANPIDMQIVGKGGREELLRGAARATELPVEKIFTGAKEAEMAAQAPAPPPQPSPDKLVDAKVQMAKIDADKEKTAAQLGAQMAERETAQMTGSQPGGSVSEPRPKMPPKGVNQ